MGLSQMRRAEAPGNNGNGQADEKPSATRPAGLTRFVVIRELVEEIKEILGAVEEEEEESEADPNLN